MIGRKAILVGIAFLYFKVGGGIGKSLGYIT